MKGVILLWIVALAALAVAWLVPLGREGTTARTAGQDSGTNSDFAGPPKLETMPETVSRPLFVATRRQPPPAAPAVPTAKPAEAAAQVIGRYRLSGVVIVGDKRRVIIAPPTGGKAVSIGEGDMIDGWKIERIAPESLTLRAGDRTEVVQLRTVPKSKTN